MKYIVVLLLLAAFCSCEDKGYIKIQNNIHNVKLESISFGEYPIARSLLTGEMGEKQTIRDKKGKFPKISKVSFYMVNNGKRAYLKTKSEFLLDADQTLTIVITDSTTVVNPAL